MKFGKRILLFLITNLAIILIITSIAKIFGLDTQYLTPNGIDLKTLAFIALIWGFAGSFFSLLMSKWIAKNFYGVKVIRSAKSPIEIFLQKSAENLCLKIGMPCPQIGIYQSKETNAFATGYSQKNALVAFSSGLLESMTHEEIEGILAHELGHIKSGDMVTMALLQGIMNAFVIFFARAVAYLIEKTMNDDSNVISGWTHFLLSIVFQIFFGILAGMIVHAFSRKREYSADAYSAKIVGKNKMIAALEKLQTLQKSISGKNPALATMKISDKKSRFGTIFSTHPSLENRIKKLKTL